METLFQLTKTQTSRIDKIINDTGILPSFRADNLNAAVYDQFDSFGILILQFYEDDRYSLRSSLDGPELPSTEIDAKLQEIQNSIIKHKHLPRIEKDSNGQINSINTIANGPNPKVLNGARMEIIPLKRKIEIANSAMQASFTALEGKSDIEIREHVEYALAYAKYCQDIARQKNIQGFRESIDKSQQEHTVKIRKKNEKKREQVIKISPKEQFTFKTQEFNVDLTKSDIKFMKTCGLDPNKIEDVMSFKNNLKSKLS